MIEEEEEEEEEEEAGEEERLNSAKINSVGSKSRHQVAREIQGGASSRSSDKIPNGGRMRPTIVLSSPPPESGAGGQVPPAGAALGKVRVLLEREGGRPVAGDRVREDKTTQTTANKYLVFSGSCNHFFYLDKVKLEWCQMSHQDGACTVPTTKCNKQLVCRAIHCCGRTVVALT